MAYIAPNSDVILMRGIPWNNTYRDTVWYPNATGQHTDITTKQKYHFTAQSYQRAGKGRIKLNILADNIYDCNYMCFRNTSFGSKWFYAFITSVEYINNDTTLVSYEIDVLQTWAFDYELERCFIERQHTEGDGVGENLVEEGLEIGELVMDGQPSTETYTTTGYEPIVAATFNATWDGSDWVINRTGGGGLYNGCYSGLYLINLYNATRANLFLAKVTNELLEENIVSFFMYPSSLLTSAGADVVYHDNVITVNKPGFDGSFPSISGYVPRNHKVYTYPFSQLMVTDGGQMAVPLRYENFSGASCSFRLIGETAVNPTVCLMPMNYLGASGSDPYNAIMMTGFPMCAYSTDLFKAYIAQTYGPAIAQYTPEHTANGAALASAGMAVGGIGSDVADLATPILDSIISGQNRNAQAASHLSRWTKAQVANTADKIKAGVNIAEQVFDKVHTLSTNYLRGFQAHGKASDTALVNFGFKGFRVYKMVMKYDNAVMVDNYFTMYGYAIKRIGIPNRHARPYWTYIKTVGCKIKGSIPFDHEEAICAIFDKGITFWNSIEQFGRYDLNNSPI